MARHKVKLADNIARVVFIETEATIGARLGTDVFTPDGVVGTPATVRSWLGITDTGGSGSGSTGITQHRLLQGLTVGNDHPQYTRRDTLTTQGDLYVRGPTSVQRLALGAEDTFLRSIGGMPVWDDVTILESVQPGLGIDVDNYDPANPIVSLNALLDDLIDVEIYDPQDGDALVYDAYLGLWRNGAGGGGGALEFEEEGAPVLTATTVNFVGSAVTVTDVGGVATVTISGGGGGNVQTSVQASDISNNTTTYADTSLTASLDAGSVYAIEYFILFATNTTPDLDGQMNYTGTGNYASQVMTTTAAAGAAAAALPVIVLAPTNTQTSPIFSAGMVITTTSGTLTFRFKQRTSTPGTPVSILAGSWMRVTKLT